MGKKIASEMDAQRQRFLEGATARGVEKAKAELIFELMAKFSGYGFYKSHSAPYALVAYQTAWLKANYPVEFIAASMTFDMGNTDKLNMFRGELKRMRIPLLPPDVNKSHADFSVERLPDGRKAVRYALGALKNVGKAAMEALVAAREAGGEFDNLFDIAERVDAVHLNKRALENLARAGAFDRLDDNRRRVMEGIEMLIRHAGQVKAEREGPGGLFGDEMAVPRPKLSDVADWSKLERLDEEAAAIGFYLTGHPLDAYWHLLEAERVTPAASHVEALATRPGLTMAGIVIRLQQRKSQRGTPFAFLQLSDPSGTFEVTLFSEIWAAARPLLDAGAAIVVDVEGRLEGEAARLTAQRIRPVEDVVGRIARSVTVTLERGAAVAALNAALDQAGPGQGRVALEVPLAGGGVVALQLPGRYAVNPALEEALTSMGGVAAVKVA
jgi:DNA polymerase-3 subunit alpha